MTDRPRQSGKQSSAQIKKNGDAEELIVQSVSLESSFPPIAWLRECDQLNPGYAKRYLDDLIEERQKITAVEIEHVRHMHSIQARGQKYGLIVGLAGLTASFAISYFGQDTVTASVVGGSTVLGLVGAFITGRLLIPNNNQDDDKSVSKPVPKNIEKKG